MTNGSVSELSSDLSVTPAPCFSRSRVDAGKAFISPLAVASDTDVDDMAGAILDEDRTHCAIVLAIRI